MQYTVLCSWMHEGEIEHWHSARRCWCWLHRVQNTKYKMQNTNANKIQNFNEIQNLYKIENWGDWTLTQGQASLVLIAQGTYYKLRPGPCQRLLATTKINWIFWSIASWVQCTPSMSHLSIQRIRNKTHLWQKYVQNHNYPKRQYPQE